MPDIDRSTAPAARRGVGSGFSGTELSAPLRSRVRPVNVHCGDLGLRPEPPSRHGACTRVHAWQRAFRSDDPRLPRETEPIYKRPADYDLEHEGDEEDIGFYRRLVQRLRPRRVLELACGSGRVTLPLAELAAAQGFEIVGRGARGGDAGGGGGEAEPRRRRPCSAPSRSRTETCARGAPTSSSISSSRPVHRCAICSRCPTASRPGARRGSRCRPGGRFVADIAMPNLAVYADSCQTPPRALVEIDLDTSPPDGSARLVRYKTTRYLPHEQRAQVRFLYDRFTPEDPVDRYVSDFESHVYFPLRAAAPVPPHGLRSRRDVRQLLRSSPPADVPRDARRRPPPTRTPARQSRGSCLEGSENREV